MTGVRSRAVWDQIQRLFGAGTVSGLTEWQLLERYALRRDEAAFASLVARHGAMVLAVCRRVLNDPDDVEDAFQATFLVLAKKAGALRPHDAVGHWLYGVAYRVSLRSRSESARRRSRERPVGGENGDVDVADPRRGHDGELGPVLDEELKRLPASYRAAVVLCYLDGLTHEEAARQLGWPLGTVKGRLSRARAMLRDRLTRRGLALTSGALAAHLAREAGAAVPAGWAEAVVGAAARVAAGEAAAGAVRTSAVALAEGVIGTMIVNQWKAAAGALVAVAALTAGVGVGALAQKDDPGADRPKATAGAAATADPAAKPAADEPKPAEKAKVVESLVPREVPEAPGGAKADPVASEGFALALKEYSTGSVNAQAVHTWSQRILDRESDTPDPSARLAAAQRHLERMTRLDRTPHPNDANGRAGVAQLDALSARYFRQEAERLVKAAGRASGDAGRRPDQGKDGRVTEINADELTVTGNVVVTTRPEAAGSSPGPGGAAAGALPGKDARSLAVLKKLDEPVEMAFGTETPLDDVLKYIREKTKSEAFPKGVPIYVDPVGLLEADKTLTAPVTIDLDGVPLKRTLYLLLRQLGLEYTVQDGLIYITCIEENPSEGPTYPGFTGLPPAVKEPPPYPVMLERYQRGEMTPEERKAFIEFLKDRSEIRKYLGPVGGGFSPSNLSPEDRKLFLEYLKFRSEAGRYLNETKLATPTPAAGTDGGGVGGGMR